MSAQTSAAYAPERVDAHRRAAELISESAAFVSPPHVCVRLMELIRKPGSSAKDFAAVLQTDPSLAARLLKVVNSPLYGLGSTVDSVARAVAVVGLRDLYNLVVAASAARSFEGLDNELVNTDTFWRHSVFVALICRELGKRRGIPNPERLFIAGLLHDIGALVLFRHLPDTMRDLMDAAGSDEEALHQAELDTLGFSHAEVGGQLLRHWNLPESLQHAVATHHGADLADTDEAGAIVRAADLLANRAGVAVLFHAASAHVPLPNDDQAAQLSPDDADAVLGAATQQLAETISLLRGN